MANITKRTNKKGEISYRIRVFAGGKADGTQILKSLTWTPLPNMSERQIQKELERQTVIFEEKIKKGVIAYDGNIKFSEYAEIWLENAQIAPKTKETYGFLLVRINQAMGHIKLQNIQAHHLESFYKNLKEDGVKNGGYAVSLFISDKYSLDKIMDENKIKRQDLSTLANIAPNTLS